LRPKIEFDQARVITVTMPAEVINQRELTAPLVQSEPATQDPRAGLTSDVDALLDVFDKIQAAVAADAAVAAAEATAGRRRDDVFAVVSPDKSQAARKPSR
jgi:hypothetical protein